MVAEVRRVRLDRSPRVVRLEGSGRGAGLHRLRWGGSRGAVTAMPRVRLARHWACPCIRSSSRVDGCAVAVADVHAKAQVSALPEAAQPVPTANGVPALRPPDLR